MLDLTLKYLRYVLANARQPLDRDEGQGIYIGGGALFVIVVIILLILLL